MVAREWSIQGKLRRWLITGTGLILLLATVVLYFAIENWLRQEFDQVLESKARALVTLTEQEASGVELEFADEYMPEFEREEEPEYFEVWIDDWEVLERSRSLGSRDLPHLFQSSVQPRFLDVALPDGRAGRLVQVDFVPQIDDDDGVDVDIPLDPTNVDSRMGLHVASVVVARSREDLDAKLLTLVGFLGGFFLVFLAVVSWLIAAVLRIGFHHLDVVAHQIRELDAESLDERISYLSQPKELVPLVTYLNELLSRLSAAFARERTLSSDLAHELRTPIAELRNLADVGTRWPDDASMARRFFEDCREIGYQMERIVVHLLSLSRLEAGTEVAEKNRVQLAPLVQACWARLANQAVEKNTTLRLEVSDRCEVETDGNKLEIIVTNLLSNAIVHGEPGQEVRCFATEDDGFATLTIANPSHELEHSDLPHLFDRFWRKDEARSDQQHGGLGLSIVRGLAHLLEIEVGVGLEPTGIFRISLKIPSPASTIVRLPRTTPASAVSHRS